MTLSNWRLVALAALGLLSLATFAPAYAVSGISLSPTSVSTGGAVTITITQVIGPLPDVFAFLSVTDPLGNVFNYTGTPFTVSSGTPVQVTFPDPGHWNLVVTGSGPNVGGTDAPGMYHVMGTYLDTTLTRLTGHFIVLTDNGNFKVPQFGQSIILLVGMMVPALLLIRQRAPKRTIA